MKFFEINPDNGEVRVKDDFRKDQNNEYEVGKLLVQSMKLKIG